MIYYTLVERNTLVLFLSDNGASAQAWGRPLDRPGSCWRLDGAPTKVGNRPDIMPGGADTFVTYGPPWANVSDTPFRGYKSTCFEGGIATPLVACWPDVIKQSGQITHQVGQIIRGSSGWRGCCPAAPNQHADQSK